jgi:tRNA-dihydrouridine synthase B
MSLRIGPYEWSNQLALAPMAGVTDRPFRQLCRQLGAGYTVSEMVSSIPELRDTRKSRLRLDHCGEPGPVVVQIAGAEPAMMADAAQYNVHCGADIIDINMGCPAKKVCNRQAGSALLGNEQLVGDILDAVIAAVEVPVTLKIRTGLTDDSINAVRIARLAEQSGIQALSVHGRTRKQAYRGAAEYKTIREVAKAVSIPVIANGDVDSPEKAVEILDFTGAAGLMIGRAAQGNPWIFREIDHFMSTGSYLAPPSLSERIAVLLAHVENLHQFYGPIQGVRIARKHISWYLKALPGDHSVWRQQLMAEENAHQQTRLIMQHGQTLTDIAA